MLCWTSARRVYCSNLFLGLLGKRNFEAFQNFRRLYVHVTQSMHSACDTARARDSNESSHCVRCARSTDLPQAVDLLEYKEARLWPKLWLFCVKDLNPCIMCNAMRLTLTTVNQECNLTSVPLHIPHRGSRFTAGAL